MSVRVLARVEPVLKAVQPVKSLKVDAPISFCAVLSSERTVFLPASSSTSKRNPHVPRPRPSRVSSARVRIPTDPSVNGSPAGATPLCARVRLSSFSKFVRFAFAWASSFSARASASSAVRPSRPSPARSSGSPAVSAEQPVTKRPKARVSAEATKRVEIMTPHRIDSLRQRNVHFVPRTHGTRGFLRHRGGVRHASRRSFGFLGWRL
jgi:hypothetical protein